jgi:hypothetical protein
LAELRPFPWVFPYDEDPTSGETHPTGRYVYRPIVSITLVGATGPEGREEATFFALVDSGAERVLAAPGIARQIGVTPDRDHPTPLKIGGETRLVHPADVTLRLAPEPGLPGVEWQAEVGFFSEWTSAPWQVLLGQVGFFDQFTVTLGRQALQLAIEEVEAFDQRYDAQ